jgi:hypothetical protein
VLGGVLLVRRYLSKAADADRKTLYSLAQKLTAVRSRRAPSVIQAQNLGIGGSFQGIAQRALSWPYLLPTSKRKSFSCWS